MRNSLDPNRQDGKSPDQRTIPIQFAVAGLGIVVTLTGGLVAAAFYLGALDHRVDALEAMTHRHTLGLDSP